ncbi:VENN motif pre-toxin domain-containing protein, partial [Biostraticola tofi]
LAAGLAGGLAGGDVASAVAGAQAGKNAVENNYLSAIAQGVKLTAQGCAEAAPCRNTLVEKGLGALLGVGAANTVLDSLSAADKEYVFGVALSGKADLIEDLTPEQRTVYDYMVGQDQKGLITIFPQPERDLTGGKLSNPILDENKGTSLTTPDKTGQQGVSHTGNTEGLLETGRNTTVTPIPEGPKKDDLAYLALKGKEAQEAAKNLGFDRRIPPQKAPFNSHGQPVFSNGKNYITPDVDSHNVTDGWKVYNNRGKRIGTYDSDLIKIKD